MNRNTEAVAPEIALQSWLRPALTPVGRSKDCAAFRGQLEAVDKLLRTSHLESMALDFSRQGWESGRNRRMRTRRTLVWDLWLTQSESVTGTDSAFCSLANILTNYPASATVHP